MGTYFKNCSDEYAEHQHARMKRGEITRKEWIELCFGQRIVHKDDPWNVINWLCRWDDKIPSDCHDPETYMEARAAFRKKVLSGRTA